MSYRRRVQIGDVFEVPTSAGFGYIQLTHFTPEDNFPLVRVLPGLYPCRPSNITNIVGERELYFTFYVLNHALKAKQIVWVSNEPVPNWAKEYPIMRKRWGAGVNEKFSWLIGSGSIPGTLEGLRRMQHVNELTAEQKKLSIDEFCSHEGLVRKLTQGWLPEHDEELMKEARKRQLPVATAKLESRSLDLYFYFTQKDNADAAARHLRSVKGWLTTVKKAADGEKWLALAQTELSDVADINLLDDELESFARRFVGEYDGSAIKVKG